MDRGIKRQKIIRVKEERSPPDIYHYGLFFRPQAICGINLSANFQLHPAKNLLEFI
jgi:hypothetical protein